MAVDHAIDISAERGEFLLSRGDCPEWYRGCKPGQELGGGGLWIAPINGGEPRRIGNLDRGLVGAPGTKDDILTPRRLGSLVLHASDIAWSPDGRRLVFPKDDELRLGNADGTGVRTLATLKGMKFFFRWSPDGTTIRLSVEYGGTSSLWEVTVRDGKVRPLLFGWHPGAYTCCGNWTHDSRYFVFQSAGNLWAIREKGALLRRGGGEPVQLTAGPLSVYWPLPSLDGKRILFQGSQSRAEFLRYDLRTRQFGPDLPGISGSWLEYSKDGKSLVYISFPDGALVKSAVDGSERLRLTTPPWRATTPHWSPDGKKIAFLVDHRAKRRGSTWCRRTAERCSR